MKQLLLSIAMLMAAVFGTQAQTTKTYTDYLTVTINGESTDPQTANIVVAVREDGKMDFSLKNFQLGSKEVTEDRNIVNVFLPVGNISLTGLDLTPVEGTDNYTFQADQSLTIQEGDMQLEEGAQWLGPMLGNIPIKMNGTICNEKLYVTIDIDMQESLGQIIYVKVGTPIDNAPLSTTEKTYTDYLVVSINGESTDPQAADIAVSLDAEGKMNFNLKNFQLGSKEVTEDGDIVNVFLPVGNISLSGLTLTPVEGTNNYTFQADQTLTIQEGDMQLEEGAQWLGPMLGDIPIKMNGVICDKKLYVTIDIDMMSSLGQIIYVTVGTPIDNTILFPKTVEPTTYTITFVVDGKTISTLELEEGAVVTAPEVEAREGYTFAWTDEVPAAATADVTINGTYTVNQYTITFVVDGQELSKSKLDFGTAIVIPTVAAREGYTFAWTDEIPATMPAKDVTINGAYTVNQYTLKVVDVNTGEIIYEGLMDYGAEITLPAMEEREGYTFEWLGTIPDVMPANEVTLQGGYTANHYTCTWILDGEKYKEMSIPYGEVVPDVTVESNERYTFNGWDNVPETMPAHDVTIVGSLVDGINSVNGSSLKAQNAYNLAGQRVNAQNARGIVVVNGKKILK